MENKELTKEQITVSKHMATVVEELAYIENQVATTEGLPVKRIVEYQKRFMEVKETMNFLQYLYQRFSKEGQQKVDNVNGSKIITM